MSDIEPSQEERTNVIAYATAQDVARGDWPDLRQRIRDAGQDAMPVPPYPATDNACLHYLMSKAALIFQKDGMEEALTWLAVHAWMEGHIEGFDAASRG